MASRSSFLARRIWSGRTRWCLVWGSDRVIRMPSVSICDDHSPFPGNNTLPFRLRGEPRRTPDANQVWSRYMNISAKRITLTLPEIGLIAMTRGALGVGIGLLLSNALEKEERRSAGLALLAVGVLTTVPILMRLRNELK